MMAKTKLLLVCFLCSIAFVLYSQHGEAAVEGTECSPEPTQMTIEYGELINCRIDPVGDTDKFRFSGRAGQTIVVQVSRHNGGYPCIELYDPDGQYPPIAGICHGPVLDGRINITLEKSGLYTILVNEPSTGETTGYGLLVERVAPPSPDATSLCFGCNVSDEINGIGDLDLYTFVGLPENEVRVTVTGRNGTTACVELFGPGGQHVEFGIACAGVPGMWIEATLEKRGFYTIVVSEAGNDETAEYLVDLQCPSGGCCPFGEVLEEDPNKETKLDLLHRFRDEVLEASPEGEHYVQLFYAHAMEVGWLLARYSELRSQSQVLLDRFLPLAQTLLAGEQAIVSQADLKEVEALLEAFAAYGSPELQADIQAVQAELGKGRVLEQFRVVVR